MRRALAVLACVWAGPAFAHAHLRSASPPVGGTVRAPPEVAITFSEAVEPAFCSIVVTDAAGARVDEGTPHAGAGATVLAVALRPLAPGAYRVEWRATSVDTHRTQGAFTFTVAP